jgi:hypothetical protein
MKTARLLIGVIGATLIAIGVRVSAQSTLPDGPNRDLVARACGGCHDLDMVTATGRSREGWEGTLDEMKNYGMDISTAERGLIVDYLATYLPPK